MSDLVLLGYIARAFGIAGGVVIKPQNPDSLSFEVGKKLLIKTPMGDERTLTIKSVINGDRVFFEEVSDRSLAERLKGSSIYLSRAEFPNLKDDEYYLYDLLHASVIDMSGHAIGEVVGFSSNKAQTLFCVKTIAGHEVLIPAVKPIINQIDFLAKIIIVDAPLGLLDPMG